MLLIYTVQSGKNLGTNRGKKHLWVQANLDRCDVVYHWFENCSVTEHQFYSRSWNYRYSVSANLLALFLRSKWRKSASWFWISFDKARCVFTNKTYWYLCSPFFFVFICVNQCHRVYKCYIMIHFDIIRYNRGIIYHISLINLHVCVFKIWQNAICNQEPKNI